MTVHEVSESIGFSLLVGALPCNGGLPFLKDMKESSRNVTGYGLLLWSLRRPNDHYLSCQLGRCGPDFVLLIRDHAQDDVRFAEIGSDMPTLVSLSRLLRVAYVASGWQTCAKLSSEHAAALAATA